MSESGDLTYGTALAELEQILRQLEGEAVDVDRLADQVRRASELIRFCRTRIGETRMQIEQVVVELDGA
jgi:exodeoxyribonuclease VII small subunit